MVIENSMSSLAELQQQRLSHLKTEVLDRQRHLLCTKLNPISHFPYLRSRLIITRDEQELINNVRLSSTTSDSTGRLLDIVATKADGFNALCDSIREEGTQMFLLEALNRSLQDAINSDIRRQPEIAYSLVGSVPLPTDTDPMLPLPDLPQSEATVDGMAELNLFEDDNHVTTSKA